MGIASKEPVFPWLGMAFLSLGMLAHSVVFTSPLPYVAFMVVDFGMTSNLDEAGYTAGWITGMFMIGRTVAGIPWGIAADTYGRRACLVISMINVGVLGLIFGFSTSFTMAVAMRFCIGLGNGFMGVCKTVVTEMVSCKEHEVRAFGYINGVWGLGLIVGPAIGGLLSRPAVQYPGVFSEDGLWGHYPYLLPSIICSIIAFIAAIGVFVFVPETLKKVATQQSYEQLSDVSEHPNKGSGTSIDDSTAHGSQEDSNDAIEKYSKELTGSFGWNERRLQWSTSQTLVEATQNPMQRPRADIEQGESEGIEMPVVTARHFTILVDAEDEEEDLQRAEESKEEPPLYDRSNDDDNRRSPSLSSTTTVSTESSSLPTEKLPASLKEIVSSAKIRLLFVIYMLYCFLIMYIDETFPLWCVTSVSNGGLGWEAAEVGETLASIGFGLVLFQIFVYEWMIKKYFNMGAVETYFRLLVWSGSFMIVLPIVSDTTLRVLEAVYGANHLHTRSNVTLRVVLVLCWLCYRVPATSAFSTLAMVVNSSVDQRMRGTMNGLIMTAGSLGNASGPIVGSTIYALMLSLAYSGNKSHKHPFLLPIDGRAVFVTGGIMAMALAFLVRKKMHG